MVSTGITIGKKQGGRPTKRPDNATLATLYAEHTATEIAEKYGVQVSTVRSWIAKARREGAMLNG